MVEKPAEDFSHWVFLSNNENIPEMASREINKLSDDDIARRSGRNTWVFIKYDSLKILFYMVHFLLSISAFTVTSGLHMLETELVFKTGTISSLTESSEVCSKTHIALS